MEKVYDNVIVGAGPAGLTAAIYLKRANKDVLLLEKRSPGGQMNQTGKVENYPGVGTIDGPSLAMNMFQQILDLKVEYKYGDVTNITEAGEYKKVITDKGEYLTKTIIIATGRKAKKLGLPNENSLSGRGVSWCAICDANLYVGKDVVVIGGGNSACEEALYLADIVNSVTIVHRRDVFTADEFLVNKVLNNKKINILFNHVVTNFSEEDMKLSTVEIENTITKEKKALKVSCAFIFIGYEPATEFLKEYDVLDSGGYVITEEEMDTVEDTIFACGDIRRKQFFQIANAVGEGATAAGSVIRKLKE